MNNIWVFLGGAFLVGLIIAASFTVFYHLATRGEDEEDYDEEWW